MDPANPVKPVDPADPEQAGSAGDDSRGLPPAADDGKPTGAGPVPKTAAVWIATAGGVGFGPWAPGTWGALLATALFGLWFGQLPLWLYVLLVVAISAAGVWASTKAERDFGRHDDGRIVIDEVAGQLVTLAPLVPLHGTDLGHIDLAFGLLASDAATFSVFGLLVVTGFVAFRWFDIRKPGRVKWAERHFEAGAGVMADDLVAGVYGGVVVAVLAYVALVSTGGVLA